MTAVGCGPELEAGPAPPCEALQLREAPKARSVVFVLVDTLRRDRLPSYGGLADAPNLERFGADHLRFDAASSAAPWTKPAIASLFTGYHPSQHGVLSHPQLRGQAAFEEPMDALADTAETLAEALAAAGYDTAAIVSNPWLTRGLGFEQGFAHYEDDFAGNRTRARRVVKAGLDWLATRGESDRPFFLYLHFMDPHAPYTRVSPAALEARRTVIERDQRNVPRAITRTIRQIAAVEQLVPPSPKAVPANWALFELIYDQGVARFDAAFGSLLQQLAERPDWDELAIVVVSDHGEALLERGYLEHGNGLHDEEIAVPLMARLPGVDSDGPIDCPVGLVDLRSTLCDYLGIPCSRDYGRSLLRGADRRPAYVVMEGVYGRGRESHRAIRNQRYKLLWQPGGAPGIPTLNGGVGEWALYDLVEDPAERNDLLQGEPSSAVRAVFEQMRTALEEAVPATATASRAADMDTETRERLRALGYVGDQD
jgi:arylsulfatase A-like enzyme